MPYSKILGNVYLWNKFYYLKSKRERNQVNVNEYFYSYIK